LRPSTSTKRAPGYRSAAIFSRAALARNADRVRPRAAAASSIAAKRPASIDGLAFTGRPASITRGTTAKHATRGKVACYTGVLADGFDAAGLGKPLLAADSILGPKLQGLLGISEKIGDGFAHRRAARLAGTYIP
jgi:hypothetical protein